MSKSIAVIGAGWAGCAAAVELAAAGHKITLYESSRTLGGRARAVDINSTRLDNGQHILLGAYSETLRILQQVGVDAEKTLLRLPLQIRYPENSDGMDFVAPRLPAPFHLIAALLRSKGLAGADKMALARFSSAARWMDWRMNDDCSVSELLQRFDQTERLIKLMWQPLCIAALNTPPERASAQIFLNVLRDSLGARRVASDMLIPRVDLTALFPQQAAAFVQRYDGAIKLGASVQKIVQNDNHWIVTQDKTEDEMYDAIVVATSASQAATLLSDVTTSTEIPPFEYEPITTCYLQYPSDTKLDIPFYALNDDPETQCWGQFVFDRGQLDATQNGLFAVVVSASTDAIELGHEALSAAIAAQLANTLQMPQLATPEWSRVITEKRATFSCTPALQRPQEQTEFPHLVLAGDYLASDYPATLESAVRSGVKAAKLLSASLTSEKFASI
ncbi:hydroxysqualene dehydroxylase HpnE [Herminiimonas fonticola]|uniref:Squalene-associated FAD-dependent desaturase n=1 Tax=Herminiimonas fonticola TaxID=303380 RepID=A0A4R6G1Y3_9BURK|nr:hydroxysqualene dehydroxylase HpnE [Herminiimonas fonticola]RBA23443.1 HpnE: squalene-associated FAD-dependent desaturase [Herminiimonas fonticola]TDN88302.1 squalene-associated FAD-dependent desaturase [Herminiimonas fonticola]